MKAQSSMPCRFSIIVSVLLIVYVVSITYFDFIQNSSMFVKTLVLALLFILIAMLLTFFNINKKNYISRKIHEHTSKVLDENETLKTFSHIDPLTKCSNEKYFLQRLDDEFKRAIREKQYLSLLIVNIDEFKAFNDIYGREEGDECIKLIANILVKHCNRSSDIISRFNGDEFYVLLPNTKDPRTVSQKCVQSVKALQIPHDNSIASNVLTISIGISSIIPSHINQKDELIARAKESLEKAKIGGRDRVF